MGQQTTMKTFGLILLLSLVCHIQAQSCGFSSDVNNASVGWFIWYTNMPVYTYYSYWSQIHLGVSSLSQPSSGYPCTAFSLTGNTSVFLYSMLSPVCARVTLTDNKGALLLSKVRQDSTINDTTSCSSTFSASCFAAGQCTATWQPKVVAPFSAVQYFNSSVTTCPFTTGVYSLMLSVGSVSQQCAAGASVSGTRLVLGACSGVSPSTPNAAKLISGLSLTCLGDIPATALVSTETSGSRIVLLASDDRQVFFCALYQSNTTAGIQNITFDVQLSLNIPCSFYNSSATSLISAILGSTMTTAAPTTAAPTTAAPTTAAPIAATPTTAAPIAATPTTAASVAAAQTSSVAGSASSTVSNQAGSSTTTSGTTSTGSNIGAYRNNADENTIKGVLIGLLVGSAVLVTLLTLLYCCTNGALNASKSAETVVENTARETAFDGNVLTADSVELVGSGKKGIILPEGQKIMGFAERPAAAMHEITPTLKSTFHFADISGDGNAYKMISSSIPSH